MSDLEYFQERAGDIDCRARRWHADWKLIDQKTLVDQTELLELKGALDELSSDAMRLSRILQGTIIHLAVEGRQEEATLCSEINKQLVCGYHEIANDIAEFDQLLYYQHIATRTEVQN